MRDTMTVLFGALLLHSPGLCDNYGGGGAIEPGTCITEAERASIVALRSSIPLSSSAGGRVTLFTDPMGGGGTNSFGKPLNNYVDLDPGSGLLDYNCGTITYNGHGGHDVEITDFYDMDEGVPFLCAAPGVVLAVSDGFFDRRLSCAGSANYVIIEHADGSLAYCWHLRKNSIRVAVSDVVAPGDMLGLVGSSGCSTWPHVHFEVSDGVNVVEPSTGPCRSGSSWWQSQGVYVMDLPFELYSHGVTTLPMTVALMSERVPSAKHVTAPGTIYSWIHCRSLQSGDVLSWALYSNGNFWNSYSFSPGAYRVSWWYTNWSLPASPALYGDWEIRIYHNGNLQVQQGFTLDASANQLPVAVDSTFEIPNEFSQKIVSREFGCEDPDGLPFWYIVQDGPSHGDLAQDGGRRRKFTYTPNHGFAGEDTVKYYVIDDRNTSGPLGEYVFVVQPEWYEDADTDGYGNRLVSSRYATAPPGYVSDTTDCDDADASVHPGAAESCNSIDDDCDAAIDEGAVCCACDCHADPGGCNGAHDIVDVVETINVAFRGSPGIPDPNASCPRERTDVNCSDATDVVDVVNMVNVAFRGASAATEFCNPCP